MAWHQLDLSHNLISLVVQSISIDGSRRSPCLLADLDVGFALFVNFFLSNLLSLSKINCGLSYLKKALNFSVDRRVYIWTLDWYQLFVSKWAVVLVKTSLQPAYNQLTTSLQPAYNQLTQMIQLQHVYDVHRKTSKSGLQSI